MGVSHGALFRHFPSREALWAEAVHWATCELERRFEACLQQPSEPACGTLATPQRPLELVAALMATHAALLQENPGLVRMLFAELQRPGTSPARDTGKAFMQRFRLRLTSLMAEAQALGSLDRHHDPSELAALLVATQQGLVLQALAHDGFGELSERSRRCMALFLSAGPARMPRLDVPAGPRAESPARTAARQAGTRRRRPGVPPDGPPAD